MTWTRIYALDGPFQGNLVAMFLVERDAVEWARAHCPYAHVFRKLVVDAPSESGAFPATLFGKPVEVVPEIEP